MPISFHLLTIFYYTRTFPQAAAQGSIVDEATRDVCIYCANKLLIIPVADT